MDFGKNSVLKENYTFFVGNNDGYILDGEHGLYNQDTRFLSCYRWQYHKKIATLLSHSTRPDKLTLHHADLDHHRQVTAIKRTLTISDAKLSDTLIIENPLQESQELTLELIIDADFADLFEARSWDGMSRSINRKVEDNTVTFFYEASDRLEFSTVLSFSNAFECLDNILVFKLTIPAKESCTLEVKVQILNPLGTPAVNPISYQEWRKQFPLRLKNTCYQAVLNRSIDDIRALLLFTKQGQLPAAGIPWFVAAFGRDALLTSYMLLPNALETARGTLRYLAKYQATEMDSFRGAQPGKILHELRFGELTRSGKTPHSPYFGTVDATPLFIMLLAKLYELEGKLDLIRELQPNWEAALDWMTTYGDEDGDGFLEYVGKSDGQALHVQSWKDSEDSMSHADGSLAWGETAVCEVQGYAFAAYSAAARFYRDLGNDIKADHWQTIANDLQTNFHKAFWLEDLQTYAMALDNKKQPLRVHSSDAGQLLWSGIVPNETVPLLVKSLMSEEMWNGWGIRTLGKSSSRYNPVSYHNGSIWPHDTALIARGMHNYGFKKEAKTIAEALFDLAASQTDLRPAELVAGYQRSDEPPVPYPMACRPQAWSSAALIYLSDLLDQ